MKETQKQKIERLEAEVETLENRVAGLKGYITRLKKLIPKKPAKSKSKAKSKHGIHKKEDIKINKKSR